MQVAPANMRSVSVTVPVAAKYKLRLVPLSTNVLHTKPGVKIAHSGVELFSLQHNESTISVYTTPKIQVPTDGKSKEAEFLVPFWFVGVTQDKSAANMELVMCEGRSSAVKVPCFANKKQLKAGDTLLQYVKAGTPRYGGVDTLDEISSD